jgi:hypothetical protein
MAWSPLKTLKTSKFWTKLTNWEYWPFEVVYFPIFFYWIWISIKARSFFFFSSANPGIEYGGMLGESKYKIHIALPQEYVPITIFAHKGSSFEQVKALMTENGLHYPIILKPDIGERGWLVSKIQNDEELNNYLVINPVDFLIQEYIDLPIELGIFYYRYPGKNEGKITSIVKKKMLEVTGNGKDTIRILMGAYPRARLQLSTFEHECPEILNNIPENGENIELMPIGNHSRGTTFLNENSLINDELNRQFDILSKRIEGFYFGRFDIRCNSETDLLEGKFKIMELNGAGAEPGHIYHPGFSLFAAYGSIISHLKALFEISRENKKRGFAYMTFSEGIDFIKRVRTYNKLKTINWEDEV